MKFGSDEVFEYVKDNIIDPKSTTWYDEIFKIVDKDARDVLGKSYQEDDLEEIVQQIQMAVTIGLTDYLKKHAKSAPEQRNGWLYNIIRNKKCDFWREKYRSVIDDLMIEPSVSDAILEKMILHDMTVKVLEFVFTLRTTPDKIIAYLYNNHFMLTRSAYSGSPANVSNRLRGMPLSKALVKVRTCMNAVLRIPVDDSIYDPLISKIHRYDDPVFAMTPHQISDSCNWINSKIIAHFGKDFYQDVTH